MYEDTLLSRDLLCLAFKSGNSDSTDNVCNCSAV
jgi:hypothetical protein